MIASRTYLQSRFVIAAVSLVSIHLASSQSAKASATGIAILNTQLGIYQSEENSTKALTTITASANDLVAALYTVLENGNFNNTDAADLAASALEASGGKFRSDKDKIAGRVAAAAL